MDDILTCPYCGKRFAKTRNFQRYCCVQCRKAKQAEDRQAKKELKMTRPGEESTLCWICDNAYGWCRWSGELMPVKGWSATKSTTHEGSYMVRRCPDFAITERCKSQVKNWREIQDECKSMRLLWENRQSG